jgi:hypothetical protein
MANGTIINGVRWVISAAGAIIGYRNPLTDKDEVFSGGGGGAWGSITGTLSDQSDLNTALAAKADDSATTTALAAKAPSAAPSFTGLETHAGTDLFTGAAMGANAIDITKARNTKTLSADTTFTFSGTPSDGQEFGIEITGHSAAVTVTIPSSRNVNTNEDITTFVMPANGYAVLTWRRKGSVNLLQGVPGTKVMIPFAIETVADGDYTIVLKSIWAGRITTVTTKSASGTCTLTAKINTTALGGTANSVSSTEQSQAHSATNTVAVGDDIVVTASGNSTCLKLTGNIEMTVF